MEEIFIDAVDDPDGSVYFLHELTEKSRLSGVQVGIPWTQNVYEYLFELPFDRELGLILESMMGTPSEIVDFEAR